MSEKFTGAARVQDYPISAHADVVAERHQAQLNRVGFEGPLVERLNPLFLLLGTFLYSMPLMITLDWVSASIALLLGLVGSYAIGVPISATWRRGWFLLVVAAGSFVSMLLYARPAGQSYFEFGLINITDNSIQLATGISFRVLAIGLPVLLVLGSIDVTRLADAMAQNGKVAPRFVLGTLAGIRLAGVFKRDWQAMDQSQRARGIGEGNKFRKLFSISFALLILAIRRASSLATAMESRGFGRNDRTWARPSPVRRQDYVFVAACLIVISVALAVSVLTGTFNFLGLSSVS
ncbi:energy-coupling factor transporter transmembrane component T family protein [Micrococcoides hystricis]|uniref:Energy-coupling factor transporter transmembrane component T family protein n=1 Tax=Micrococcoides hystricis TaxID=1572761 RepID=A0ABV6P7Q8_9MICC